MTETLPYRTIRIGGHQKNSEAREVTVDAEDYERIASHKWTVGYSGGREQAVQPVAIRRDRERRTTVTMHREILRLKPDDRRKVIHLNGDNLDNRKANLEIYEAKQKRPPVVTVLEPPDGPCIRVGGNRPRRRGEPSTIRWARVDEADLEFLSQWKWTPIGRKDDRVIAVRRERQWDGSYAIIQMHRQIMGLTLGDPRQVDHRNGDSLDNRRSNLRVVSASQNAQNRPKEVHLRRAKNGQKQRTSQHRGVVYEPKYRLPWAVVLRFPTEDEAAAARREWQRKYMPYADPDYDGSA